MKNIKQGYVYLTEVCDNTVRPAIVVNVFGDHSVIIPLRRVSSDDICTAVPVGQCAVQFENNQDEYSMAQVDSIKSVPNKKIGRELGRLYDIDARACVMLLLTELEV